MNYEISSIYIMPVVIATIVLLVFLTATLSRKTSQNMVEQANSITRSSQDVATNSHELASTSETLTTYVQKFKI